LLTAEEYHFAIYVAPIYIYYQVFAVLGMVAYWLIYYHPHKTFWQIPINVIGLVSNTTANIILIPKYGIMGAAMAIFFSSGLAQVIQLIIGLKIIPIPINNVKLLALFSMVFFETGVLYYLYYLKSWFYFDLVVKIFLLVLFFCFGIILKIFHSQDLKHIVRSFLKTKC
jgi:hypothetical protein